MARVLLVEDEAAIAQTVEYALRADGFETAHALTGHEALQLAQRQAFDLAILDVGLPDIGGFALAARLAVLAVREQVVVASGARKAVHVGMAPRVQGHRLAEVRPEPFG